MAKRPAPLPHGHHAGHGRHALVQQRDADLRRHDHELVHTETRIEEEDTVVPYPVNYYEDPDLEPDAEIVLVAGQNGLTHVKSEVTYRNGKEVSRVIVQETVQTKPVTQLVIRGVDRTIMEQPADPEPAEQAAPGRLVRTASAAPRPARRPPAAHAMTAPLRRAATSS